MSGNGAGRSSLTGGPEPSNLTFGTGGKGGEPSSRARGKPTLARRPPG